MSSTCNVLVRIELCEQTITCSWQNGENLIVDLVFDYTKQLLLHIFRYDNHIVVMFSKITSILEINTEILVNAKH